MIIPLFAREAENAAYARDHGSLAGVPAAAVNLLTSKPVRLPRGGAMAVYMVTINQYKHSVFPDVVQRTVIVSIPSWWYDEVWWSSFEVNVKSR